MALVLAACSVSGEEPVVVSAELVESAVRYQAEDGLFYMPDSSAHQSDPGIVITANYVDLAPKWSERNLSYEEMDGLHLPDPETVELGDLQAALALISKTPSSSNIDLQVDADFFSANVPQRSEDVATEITILWLWASSLNLGKELTEVDLFEGGLLARYESVDLDQVDEHPFLVHRMVQIERLVAGQRSVEFDDVISEVVQRPLISPTTTKSILDALAIQRLRHERGLSVELNGSFQEELSNFSESPDFALDDLTLAATLGLLEASENGGDSEELESRISSSVSARLDETTGLLVPVSPPVPTIAATFAFARVLESSFSEVVSEQTIEALIAYQSDRNAPLSGRLQASYALRESGFEQWEDGLGVGDIQTEITTSTSPGLNIENLRNYLDVMSAAAHLYPDLPRKELHEFPIEGDQQLELLAAASIRLSYLFSNEVDVRSMFSDLQDSLHGLAIDESTPFQIRLKALATLAAAGYKLGESATYDDVGSELALERRCEDGLSLFSIDGQPNSTCSLTLTLEAKSIPRALL